jgi:transcriptional regulator of arginine metabolism
MARGSCPEDAIRSHDPEHRSYTPSVATQTWLHAPAERGARGPKRERQRAVRELVGRHPVSSQQELVELLATRGFAVTQATVSRDIAELGLVKVTRAERHVYAAPEELAHAAATDAPLMRLLGDVPVTIRRSGLTLLLITDPGMASALSQAIDQSTLQDQEGTLAGENTVLVLFADEERLERWRSTVERLRHSVGSPARTDH